MATLWYVLSESRSSIDRKYAILKSSQDKRYGA